MNADNGQVKARRRRVRNTAAVAAVLALGGLGGAALVASSDAWSGGWHGRHMGWGAGGPEWVKDRALDRTARWLGRVDATDEQREAVNRIVGETADTLGASIPKHRETHREWMTELSRPDIDTEALERLRAAHLVLIDEHSRTVLDAVVAIGTVLTADQRQELLAHLERRKHRRWWHRGERPDKD